MYLRATVEVSVKSKSNKRLIVEIQCLILTTNTLLTLNYFYSSLWLFNSFSLRKKFSEDYTRDIVIFPGYIIIISKYTSIFIWFLSQLQIPKIKFLIYGDITWGPQILNLND